MKVLQICNKPSFPPADGGAIAIGSMTRSLVKNGCEVTVLNMVSYKHGGTDADWPEDLRNKVTLHFAPVDLRLKPLKAFLNLFSSRSYHAERFYSNDFSDRLASILKSYSFDIIHLETTFPMMYLDVIRKHSKAKLIVRLHNIENEVWSSTAHAEENPFRRWYLNLLAERLRKFEREILSKADGVITISPADFKKMNELLPGIRMTNIPLGLDLSKYSVSIQTANAMPSLFHLGAMDWIPNQVGMNWFLETAWKQLRVKYPGLKFFIAGRKMPKKFFGMKDEQLIVEGEVANPVQFMKSKDIMVVPILSGSGIRVKIIEGMAQGKTIVTTSIGAAGIDCTDGENILLADTPDELVRKISACIEDSNLIAKIGTNARKLIEEKYSLEMASAQLNDFYHSAMR